MLDARSETSNVLAGAAVSTFSTVTAVETNGGDAKLVTWTNTQGDDVVLDVQVTDASTGALVLSTTGEPPAYTERSYAAPSLQFDGDESPADYIYLVLIDFIDATGEPFGQQTEVELTIPQAVEGGVGRDYAVVADGFGALSALVNEQGYRLHLVVQGDDIGAITGAKIIFEEPFEGPAPLELEVRVDFASQLNKWVQKGSGSWPDNFVVATTLARQGGLPSEV
ncbi:MAG: hypothetical protein ACI9MR_000538 [Myxococcota bacterium]